MPDRDPLRRVADAAAGVVDAQSALRSAVLAAREAGRSWAEVGATLGVSRQAAFKRFGTPTDPRTGAAMTRRTAADVSQLAVRTLEALAAGGIEEVRSSMTVETAQVLDAARLADTWARVVAESGALLEAAEAGVRTPEGERLTDGDTATGVLVGVVALTCEAGQWEGRVASDGDGRVVGLLICPPGATGLAF